MISFINFTKNIIKYLCTVFEVPNEDSLMQDILIHKNLISYETTLNGLNIRIGSMRPDELGTNLYIHEEMFFTGGVGHYHSKTSIGIWEFQSLYEDDNTLLQLSTVANVDKMKEAMHYIKNLKSFIVEVQKIIKDS